tara:strand:- start:194 stop:481 length:288 start_codon:yes stop_codon:yes gene_type:complete
VEKQKNNMANGNGNNAIQAVVEHSLVKTVTPIAVSFLLAIVGWLFSTVMDVEKLALENKTHIKHLHMAEEAFGKQMEQVETKLTDLRINVGRLVH